jgi:hypothetical protein
MGNGKWEMGNGKWEMGNGKKKKWSVVTAYLPIIFFFFLQFRKTMYVLLMFLVFSLFDARVVFTPAASNEINTSY